MQDVVGLQIFCRGNSTNSTNDAGAFGAQCEGKITTFRSNQTVSICEGAFQSFASKGFKAPDGKFVRASRAYGCLGTSVGLRSHAESTSLSNIDWSSFELNTTNEGWLSAASGKVLSPCLWCMCCCSAHHVGWAKHAAFLCACFLHVTFIFCKLHMCAGRQAHSTPVLVGHFGFEC